GNRIQVRLTVGRVDDHWLIVNYEEDRSPSSRASAAESNQGSAASAANVVRAYYRAIDERRNRDAYLLWESNGVASGKSFDEFQSGFSETAAVETMLGTPGRLEGAAGSRYVD